MGYRPPERVYVGGTDLLLVPSHVEDPGEAGGEVRVGVQGALTVVLTVHRLLTLRSTTQPDVTPTLWITLGHHACLG